MKKNMILILILMFIWWIYFWINYYSENSRKINNEVVWFNFDKFNFDNIKTNKLEIKNKKVIYSWTWEYITDKGKMDKFILDLKDIKIKSIASTNKSNFEKFWISNSWSIVKIDNVEIILWKNKWYYGEEYIKIKWDEKIYLLNKDLKNILDKDIDFFKKKDGKKENNSWSLDIKE